MADVMTNEEARQFFKTKKLPERFGETKKKTSNKYRNVWTEYNGKKYQSKREAKHAYDLDMLKRAGEVRKWVGQCKFDLIVEGEEVGTYAIDFKVWWSDGRITYDEVKGFETELWKLKWNMVHEQFPDYEFRLIK